MIETNNLNYSYGNSSRQTLSDINLRVPKGSIYCFLGPNGAGKTTTLRLLLGLLPDKDGAISIDGRKLKSNRIAILRIIGSLIEYPSVYTHLTGAQNLEIFRLTYRCEKKRIEEVLRITNMWHAKDQIVSTYSLGMKQRLAIALALLNDPELLILDEPTNGLDPQGIVDIRELIIHLQKEHNKTIIVSSHLLSEAARIATHFGIINNGTILFQGPAEDLDKLKSKQSRLVIDTADSAATLQILGKEFKASTSNHSLVIVDGITRDNIPIITRTLVEGGVDIYSIGFEQNDLEEKFFQLLS